MTDPAERIAEWATRTRWEDLPPAVVERGQQFLLDTLAVMLAGTSAEMSTEAAAEIADWGGKAEATVAVFGYKVPARSAAMVNSLFVHANDFDDTHDVAGLHANVTTIPTALAVAQSLGGVTGRELLTAIALGVEVNCRIGLGMEGYHGWHLTTLAGTFGATVTAGRLLGLTAEQLQFAMGIALSQAGGSVQGIQDGTLIKRLQPGFASQAGITAALLARRGMTGPRDTFSGKFGFFRLYDPPNPAAQRDPEVYSQATFLNDLGRRWEAGALSAKPYPCCRGNHGAIDAVRELRARHGVIATEVEQVRVRISPLINNLVGRPYRPGKNAQVDAQFNLPYAIACALLSGDVTIADYGADALFDPVRQALADRVEIIVDPVIRYKLPVHMEIATRDGKRVSTTVERLRGEPGSMDWHDFVTKFQNCLPHAARPMPEAERIPAAILALPEADATSSNLTDSLAPSA